MPGIAGRAVPVTGGVDTHAGVHVAAVVDQAGRVLGTRAFPADTSGYAGALAWAARRRRTGQGGGGGHRQLRRRAGPPPGRCGVWFAGVIRPDRQARRRRGGRGAGRPQWGGVQRAEEPRWVSRVDPDAAGGPARCCQGPHPSRQPAARPDRDRARGAAAAAGGAACGQASGDGGTIPARRPARPTALGLRWPVWPAAITS